MSLRNRIEELERVDPGLIELTLDDGSTRAFPGLSAKEFVIRGMDQIRERSGPIFDAIGRAVDGRNCGRLWQLLRAMWCGPVDTPEKGNSC
jgi:hypothetical protein